MTLPDPHILHIDLDAFFASVEKRDRPELSEVPIAVAGTSKRTAVTAACYLARACGVRAGMTLNEAKTRCPGLTVVAADLAKYSRVSRDILELFLSFSPDTEMASIDEAYMDVSGVKCLHGESTEIARKIQNAVKKDLRLSCSIGIAPNKLLAKLGSDMKKPGGITVIHEHEISALLANLPVGKLCGIGKKMERALRLMNIKTAGELGRFPVEILEKKFGVIGRRLHEMGQGIDVTPVIAHADACDIKSISNSTTVDTDLSRREQVSSYILKMAASVGRRARLQHKAGRTITLSLRFSDFTTLTRSTSVPAATNCDKVIYDACLSIFDGFFLAQGVRAVGVRLSNLETCRQLSLFSDPRRDKLDAALDALQDKYGFMVRYGSLTDT